MDRTIFSRGTTGQLESWSAMQVGDSQWISMMRRTKMTIVDGNLLDVRYQLDPYGSRSRVIMQFDSELGQEFKRKSSALEAITGAPRHMALYFTLLSHNLLDSFINKFQEAINAPTQSA